MQQDKLTAGDSLNFTTAGGDYPASSGWVLSYLLVPRAGGAAITITAAASGDDHQVAVAASTTANWAPGDYTWYERVNKSGEKYTLRQGQLSVAVNPDTISGAFDSRSDAEKALAAVTAVIQGRATDAVMRYKINGREIERYPLADLLRLQQQLEAQVAAERRAAGLTDPRGTPRRVFLRTP